MASAGKIRSVDMRLIDDLFEMGGGYVLDFSNKTFAEFFEEEINVNINDPKYDGDGTSKAKRLRLFLNTSDTTLRIKTLLALWEYREQNRRRNRREETVPDAEQEFKSLIQRLGGQAPVQNKNESAPKAPSALNPEICTALLSKLMEVSRLAPHMRGYAYERFLKDLFDANGLLPRASFRLVGEQIDGSFELSSETYLLEAKWTSPQVGAADLRAFNGKVEDKAAWSRGLFVSDSGFSSDGLEAFGRGKRVVCMDGLDVYEMLHRKLSFAEVMSRKVRRAAESGNPFVRVRDLWI